MIQAVFFDLFFTLIVPRYQEGNEEYSILQLSKEQWETYAEQPDLYKERAVGKILDEGEIIEKITAQIPQMITRGQKELLLRSRKERMKRAMDAIDPVILETICRLKKRHVKIGLISNADVIDCFHWENSVLAGFFDCAVFSCNAGCLKPDQKIYEKAMKQLMVPPEECLFVGDGGGRELEGAKAAGMKTVLSEYLEKKDPDQRKELLASSDAVISWFPDLVRILQEQE